METLERKRLPIAEIEAMYPEHWILIDEPEIDASDCMVNGIAMFAHPDKTEVHRKIGELRPTRFALHCTLKDPPDQRYLL
jgi:hypothetical protein